MSFQELLKNINQSIDNLDLVSARRYIEENIEQLTENKHLLRRNARELLEFLLNKSNAEEDSFNRRELNAIYTINTYATRFDVRGLRLSVKNNSDLLMRVGIVHYLNADAKILLESMNAIQVS